MDTKTMKCHDCGKDIVVNKHAGPATCCGDCSRAAARRRRMAAYEKKTEGRRFKEAKTTIELLPPFTEKWDSAYLVFSKREGRRVVVLRNTSTKAMTSTAYARYLLSVKIGRILRKNEQVDHIDGDKSNDVIDNLQLLTVEEHQRKTSSERSLLREHRLKNRVPRHGTYWEHVKYGCNCPECVAAYREYSRKSSARHRDKLREKRVRA